MPPPPPTRMLMTVLKKSLALLKRDRLALEVCVYLFLFWLVKTIHQAATCLITNGKSRHKRWVCNSSRKLRPKPFSLPSCLSIDLPARVNDAHFFLPKWAITSAHKNDLMVVAVAASQNTHRSSFLIFLFLPATNINISLWKRKGKKRVNDSIISSFMCVMALKQAHTLIKGGRRGLSTTSSDS